MVCHYRFLREQVNQTVILTLELCKRWSFKHPYNDFFRTMENIAGEDLSWFWRLVSI
jgi:hypothetical protein